MGQLRVKRVGQFALKYLGHFLLKQVGQLTVKWVGQYGLKYSPDGSDLSILYEFNGLRNKYLKQLTHEIDDYTPIRILHRIFERVLITEIGLKCDDYKKMIGNH